LEPPLAKTFPAKMISHGLLIRSILVYKRRLGLLSPNLMMIGLLPMVEQMHRRIAEAYA